jgi:uroporphyrin-III C-methyltransferase
MLLIMRPRLRGVLAKAVAVAAYLGTSLTKRGVARRGQMVTGHDVDGKPPEDLDIAALADPGATTCVFIGKATFLASTEAARPRPVKLTLILPFSCR